MDFYKEWLGIPEGPRPPDHYELLRCKRFEDDPEKVRAHYKKLNNHVRKYATGQYSVQSQDLLNELAKAMLCLTDPERKRDYDESLGREFEAARDVFGRQPVLDVLVAQGKLTREQKREVETFAERRGLSERDAAVQMKLVDAETAARALAVQLGFSFVDLDDMLPEDAVLDMSPRSLVKKHQFLPLFVDDDRLMIAVIDEIEHELEEELRLRYGVPIRPVIVAPRSLSQAIAKYYAAGARDESVAEAALANAGKSGGGGKKGGKSAKAGAPRPPMASLDDAGQKERKQFGILAICWSLILPMIPTMLPVTIKTRIPLQGNLGFHALLAIACCGATTWWVLKRYWK